MTRAQRPLQTFASRLLARFIRWSEKVPLARRTIMITSALVATVGVDTLIGGTASMSLFYLMISFLGGWWFGQRGGMAVALINAGAISVLGALSDRYDGQGAAVLAWNLSVRFTMHLLYATIAAGLRQTLENERWLASYDALTGALNVRAFRQRTDEAVAAAQRRGERLLIGYLDLDGFKGVNDRFGHPAGDKVLQSFAEAAQATLRREDLFARVGGDEFAVLMALPASERGEDLAELLHRRLTAVLADTGYAVTCSMGAVVLEPLAIASADAALARADTLMYEVKESGRNALRLIHLGAIASPAHALTRRAAAVAA